MAIKISNTDVIDNARKGILQSVNPGAYTTGGEPASPSPGDIIYNSTENEPQYWDGTTWQSLFKCSGSSGGNISATSICVIPESLRGASFGDDGSTVVCPDQLSSDHYFPIVELGPGGGMTGQATLKRPDGSMFGVPVPTRINPNCAASFGDFLFATASDSGGNQCLVKINKKTRQVIWEQPFRTGTAGGTGRMCCNATGDVIALLSLGSSNGSALIQFNGSSGAVRWCRRLNGDNNSPGSTNGSPSNMVYYDGHVYAFVLSNFEASVQKVDVSGTSPIFRWGRTTTGKKADYTTSAGGGVDSDGNVYLTSLAEPNDNTTNTDKKGMVTKLDPNGGVVWQRQIDNHFGSVGGRSFTHGSAYPGVTDSNGNTYFYFACGVTIGGRPYPGAVIVQIDKDGNRGWSRCVNGTGFTYTEYGSTTEARLYHRGPIAGGGRAGFTLITDFNDSYTGNLGQVSTSHLLSIPEDGRISNSEGLAGALMWSAAGDPTVTTISPGVTSKNTNTNIGFSSGTNWGFYAWPQPIDAQATLSPWPTPT